LDGKLENRDNQFKENKRMTSQRIGKYACLETERRYLLKTIPDDLAANANGWLITDHYLPNTRLRLRKMESLAGNDTIHKLTQKYRAENQNPYETTITNVYLNDAEYNFLQPLEAKIIRKRRYPYNVQNYKFSIDVFEGRHQGLILAEMEFEKTSELNELVLPMFTVKDVTDDPFFSGGNLAMVSDEEFRQGLSQRIRNR
jgi:CYTH domain-containing protein